MKIDKAYRGRCALRTPVPQRCRGRIDVPGRVSPMMLKSPLPAPAASSEL